MTRHSRILPLSARVHVPKAGLHTLTGPCTLGPCACGKKAGSLAGEHRSDSLRYMAREPHLPVLVCTARVWHGFACLRPGPKQDTSGSQNLARELAFATPQVINNTGYGRAADVWSLGCAAGLDTTAKQSTVG